MKLIRYGPYRAIVCTEESYIEDQVVYNAIICCWTNKKGWHVQEWESSFPLATSYESQSLPDSWKTFIREELREAFHDSG